MADSPVLQYDSRSDRLWFPIARGTAKMPYPLAAGMQTGRFVASYSARYPMSLIGTRAFKALYPNGLASKEALQLIQRIKAIEADIAERRLLTPLEGLFRVAPYEHQRDAIEHMLHYPRLALLLEQGLGKTFISIMAVMCFRALGIPHKSLIVCPNIVFQGWLQEFSKYSDLRVRMYKGDPAARAAQRAAIGNEEWDCVLTTFDMLLDKTGTSQTVLLDAWAQLSRDSQRKYAERWLSLGLLDTRQHAHLGEPKDTLAWKTECARILKKIPMANLPLGNVLDAKKENSNASFLRSVPFDNLVIDEASRCLDPKSRRSQMVEALACQAKRVYLLSGTLCVGRPTDLYMPMNILGHDILAVSWTKFIQTYCRLSQYNKHVIIGYKNLDQLKTLIAPHVISKTRSECIDLPKRIFVRRYYEIPKDMRKLYNAIAKNNEIEIDGNTVVVNSTLIKIAKCLQVLNGFIYYGDRSELCSSCAHILDCVANDIRQGSKHCHISGAPKVRRLTYRLPSNPKLQLLLEDLEDTKNEKTIIWAWYKEDIQAIGKLLTDRGIRFITADEEDCAARFERTDDIRIFLGQTVQGIGITLNSATCTIYYSHGAALEPRLQSMDRNYRIGQTRPVVVKDYLSHGTIEEMLVSLLSHKTDVKKFMQESIQCFNCPQMLKCQDAGTQYLADGCLFYGDRKRAETIRTLHLSEI
jgi:SNF2 family DNA or RNA helicase